jgi:hypothetical protein
MKTNNKVGTKHKDEELRILQKSAKSASGKAIRASKAMGLTMKCISNNEIVEMLPDGERKVLRKINVTPVRQAGLKKGVVLCKK